MLHLILMLAAALAGALPLSETQLPASVDLKNIRAVAVQHDGRWPPLDTVARDVVQSVTGEVFFEGNDPVLLLLGCQGSINLRVSDSDRNLARLALDL